MVEYLPWCCAGYDGGVTGGVSVMPEFQAKFFPEQLQGATGCPNGRAGC